MSFDGTEVIYPRNEWHKITLAYAMSIHKSQGSEFQVVILPITRQSRRLLQRNLIYTAITRSKSKLVMLGEIAAFDYAIKNEGSKRKTYLVQRFTANPEGLDNSEAIENPDEAKESQNEPNKYIRKTRNLWLKNPSFLLLFFEKLFDIFLSDTDHWIDEWKIFFC